jgi:hypothetical protein
MADGLSLLWPAVALVTLFVVDCQSRDEYPPTLTGYVVEDPRSCGDIQSASGENHRVLVDGKPANCAVDGLSCPLGERFDSSTLCPASQRRFAFCQTNSWMFDCIDAGARSQVDADASAFDVAIDRDTD